MQPGPANRPGSDIAVTGRRPLHVWRRCGVASAASPTRLAPVLVTWAAATVVDVLATRPGVQELTTRTTSGEDIPALAYTDLVGDLAPAIGSR